MPQDGTGQPPADDASPTSLLAVYGTLRRGYRNYPLIEAGSRHLGAGHLPGRLVHVVTGLRRYSYPGYLPHPSPGPHRVVVEVVDIIDPALWATLDELERYRPDDPAGSEYARRTATATMVDGTQVTCWTYVYTSATDGYAVVPSGDWASVAVADVTGL